MLINQTIKQNVKHLLETQPETRDSDNLLEWNYLITYILKSNSLFPGLTEIRSAFLHPHFHTESIRRYRQMLQRQFTHLAGTRRTQRFLHEEKVVDEVLPATP